MRLPNFLFVGADKAGSTWLHRVLQHHPDCFVPACKDIYFFDRFYARGLKWYASFFKGAPASAVAVGELSHDYLYSDDAAERIASVLPEARIVIILRHPVERTFSEYLYLVRSGLARPDSLRETLAADSAPIEHSRYARHLPRYVNRFPAQQIGIFQYDELTRDPDAFAASIYSFLGLRPVEGTDFRERVLPAARPRSGLLARALKAGATGARVAGFPGLVGRVKSSAVTRALYVPYTDADRPTLSADDREWLHSQLDPDTVELEGLLGRSLTGWKREAALSTR